MFVTIVKAPDESFPPGVLMSYNTESRHVSILRGGDDIEQKSWKFIEREGSEVEFTILALSHESIHDAINLIEGESVCAAMDEINDVIENYLGGDG